MEKMIKLPINDFVLITNNKYFWHFEKWLDKSNYDINIEIINDNTMSNDDKLWAVWDIQYAIDGAKLDDDLFVVCADNLFDFNLLDSYESFIKTWKSTIVAYDVKDIEKAKRLWIIDIDENNKILNFVEKPENPSSTLNEIIQILLECFLLDCLKEMIFMHMFIPKIGMMFERLIIWKMQEFILCENKKFYVR